MERKKLFNFTNQEIAIGGILLTFVLLFILIPMKFLPIDVAVIPLIAVFVACQTLNAKMGVFLATMLGLASFSAAFVRPDLLSPIFYNPLVSIVPRVIIGFTTYYSFKGMLMLVTKLQKKGKIKSNKAALYVSSMVSAIVGVVTNTSLVLSMMLAFNAGKTFGGIYIDKTFIYSLLGVNFIIELCVSALLTPPIVIALWNVLKKDKTSFINKIAVKGAESEQIPSN